MVRIFDWKWIVLNMLPPLLRKQKLIALCNWLVIESVAVIYTRLSTWRDYALVLAGYTGQVCYLQSLLNSRLGLADNTIYIGDSKVDAMYWASEQRPVYWYFRQEVDPEQKFMYFREEEVQASDDFLVFVPAAIVADTLKVQQIRGIVDTYRIAGKTYSVISY